MSALLRKEAEPEVEGGNNKGSSKGVTFERPLVGSLSALPGTEPCFVYFANGVTMIPASQAFVRGEWVNLFNIRGAVCSTMEGSAIV